MEAQADGESKACAGAETAATTTDESPSPKPPDPAPKGGAGWRGWVRRLAPYVVAAVAITVILTRYSAKEIAKEMARGDTLAMLPYAAVTMILSIVVVAAADTLVLQGCLGKPDYLSVVMAKAAIGLLGALGYAAGHGGYGLWIARRTGARLALTSGIVLYIMSSELASVSLVATLSMWIGRADGLGRLRVIAPVIVVVLVTLKLIGPLDLLGRRRPRMLLPWKQISAPRALGQILIRVAQMYLIITGTWLAANAFGMSIPAWVMATYLPIVLVVGSMPVNIAGFGAVQGAWLLLAPWANGEQVLAFSVLWQLMCGAVNLLRGLPFVRRVVREIDAGAATEAEAR